MKQPLLTLLILGAALIVPQAQAQAQDKPDLNTPKAKFSYAVGADTGNRLHGERIEVDLDLVLRGLKDALAGNSALDEKALREVFQTVLPEHRKKVAEQNKLDGEKFLAENKSKPGVVVRPSGLQYKVLAEGSGASPATNDLVTVQYRGTLIDGTEFDSSAKRGQPIEMNLSRVVKGWQEAIPLMKTGAKWQLFIPAELAYGPGRSGQYILPNSALIFEIELVSFKPAPPPAAPAATPAAVPATPAAAPRSEPVTSDIIKVPSKEEMEKGAKIEVIKKEDLEKLQKEQQQKKDAEKK